MSQPEPTAKPEESAPTGTWYLTSFVAGSIWESVPTLRDSAHTATTQKAVQTIFPGDEARAGA